MITTTLLPTHAIKTNFIISLLTISILTSCSTASKSTILGSAIGLGAGALIGSAFSQNGDHEEQNRGAIIGGAIGAGLGGLAGYHAFNTKEKESRPLPPIKGFEKDPKPPSVTMPEVRRIWVPDKIDGNKYESGHWLFILEKTSTWSQSNEK